MGNEDTVVRVIAGASREELAAIQRIYMKQTKKSLVVDLGNELDSSDEASLLADVRARLI
jgi:hypothetical protein